MAQYISRNVFLPVARSKLDENVPISQRQKF